MIGKISWPLASVKKTSSELGKPTLDMKYSAPGRGLKAQPRTGSKLDSKSKPRISIEMVNRVWYKTNSSAY
jgi:hypothetical protein